MAAAFGERAKYVATLDSTYRTEKSRLESTISAYQMENSILESATVELRRELQELRSRFGQANEQISQNPSVS
jgi:predicted RNase H-like nuclease (RuvC/YqgF family)